MGARWFDGYMGRLLRRYAYVNYTNMASFTEAFAEHLRARTVPRDPFLLLPAVGIDLQRAKLSRASRAVWVRAGDVYAIHYSEYEPKGAARFSLWHETFEMLAGHPCFPSVLAPEWKEKLADRFAALVLMPEWALRVDMHRFATNGEGLAAVLADRFGVSLAAMRRRLREMGQPHPGSIPHWQNAVEY
jgi:hypothetical protein